MFWTALAVMMAATTAQHLGLTEAVADIIRKISQCPKCCSFWLVGAVLVFLGCDPLIAVGLSLIMAYMSYWFALFLTVLNKLYNRVWKLLQRRKRKR